jgi:hypothetical protein
VSAHRIGLPAPWQVSTVPASRDSSDADSVISEAATGKAAVGEAAFKAAPLWPGDLNSLAIFRRRFQRPSGLDGNSQIALEVELLEPLPFTVTLNGQACTIGRQDGLHFELPLSVTDLQPGNQIEIAIAVPLPTCAVAGSPGPSVEPLRIGHHYLKSVALRLE